MLLGHILSFAYIITDDATAAFIIIMYVGKQFWKILLLFLLLLLIASLFYTLIYKN